MPNQIFRARWARIAVLGLACLVLVPLVASCDDATGPGAPAQIELSADVAPLQIDAGASDTIAAIVRDASGRAIPNVPVTWSSSDTAIVRVADGILTADSSGTARITASVDTIAAWIDVTVVQSVAALSIEPADTLIQLGSSFSPRVVALDATGREMPLPATAVFSSSDSVKVRFNSSGVASGVGWGQAELRVEVDGISATATVSSEPSELDLNGIKLVSISVGSMGHACGLDADGVAYCWGQSKLGETGYQSDVPLPIQPVPTSLRFVDIDAGQQMTCGLTAAGEIWCWGTNATGVLGQGLGTLGVGKNWSAEPLLVTGGHQWTALGVGPHHGVCAVDTASVVYCWGHNDLYQLGRPAAYTDSAVAPITGDYRATQVEVGIANGCALSTDGQPICWGLVWPGQLPNVVNGAPPLKFLAIEQRMGCGLAAQGEAYCWGRGDSLSLGRSGVTDPQFWDAGPVAGGLQFTELHVGEGGPTCGIAKSGLIHCWGAGYPWPGFPDTPPPPFGGSEHTFVDLDSFRGMCAVTTTGRVFCW